MEKIDLTDKFFHSPNWENKQDLQRFRSIIKSGVLLTPKESGYSTRYFNDRIFFAAHPDSKMNPYYENDEDNGFDMATRGTFFIFNSKLNEDYVLVPGAYQYEYTTTSNVDLYKYLVGIGNAGLNIDGRLVYCYYYLKYINGEISLDELIQRIRERNLNKRLSEAVESTIYNIYCGILPEYDYLPYVLAHNPEDFIRTENYFEIEKILKEAKKDIVLCDKFGYCVNPQGRMQEIKEMKEYIDHTPLDEKTHFEKAKEICLAAENFSIRH